MKLGNLILQTTIDYNTRSNKVIFNQPEIGTYSYIENSECYLQLTFEGEEIFIDYYCEDGFMLSEAFEMDFLAKGNLTNESFEEIQMRALDELKKLE